MDMKLACAICRVGRDERVSPFLDARGAVHLSSFVCRGTVSFCDFERNRPYFYIIFLLGINRTPLLIRRLDDGEGRGKHLSCE